MPDLKCSECGWRNDSSTDPDFAPYCPECGERTEAGHSFETPEETLSDKQ